MNSRFPFVCICALALALSGAMIPSPAAAQLVVEEDGFCVTELDPGVGAKGGECSPGGIWGDYVYFGDSSGNRICRVDFSDNSSIFASGSPFLLFPVGMAFGPGPGSDFGDYLYVAAYNSHTISRITTAGVVDSFTALTAPGDVAFDPSGVYGNELFATTAFAGPISKVTPAGIVSTFSTVTSTYIRFGPGGAWGTGMYSTCYGAPGVGIITVDAAGTPSAFSVGASFTTPEGFDWAYGPGFDGDMFVPDLGTGNIWRVKSDGSRTVWATLSSPSSVVFCNGNLYITSYAGGCWKVEPCPPVTGSNTTWGKIKSDFKSSTVTNPDVQEDQDN